MAAPFSRKKESLYRWQKAVATIVYAKTETSDIPTEDLRIIAHLSSDDAHDTKYADRIKSPVTAVRAFCINCQGGGIANVRNCTNMVCPLFPFRMGSNALFGRIANADAVAEDIEEVQE